MAPDAFHTAIMSQRVSWVLDADPYPATNACGRVPRWTDLFITQRSFEMNVESCRRRSAMEAKRQRGRPASFATIKGTASLSRALPRLNCSLRMGYCLI